MESPWRDSKQLEQSELPADMQEILTAGWLVGPAQSLLLARLYGAGWGSGWSAETVAQHEFEVNDLWISSEGVSVDRDRFLIEMASRGRTAAYAALKSARGIACSALLVAVISIGVDDDFLTHGTTVKLFTQRGQYPRTYDNLERFQLEAMAVLGMNDIGVEDY